MFASVPPSRIPRSGSDRIDESEEELSANPRTRVGNLSQVYALLTAEARLLNRLLAVVFVSLHREVSVAVDFVKLAWVAFAGDEPLLKALFEAIAGG